MQSVISGNRPMGVVSSISHIKENIIHYESSRNYRSFVAEKLNFHATKYYLAYKVTGDDNMHFLWGKYIGFRWNGLENYDPYITNGTITRKAVTSLLGEPFHDKQLYMALVNYYEKLNFRNFSKSYNEVSFWKIDDVITINM